MSRIKCHGNRRDARRPSRAKSTLRNTFQPHGRWNLIASDLITQHHLGDAEAAHVLAALNVAMIRCSDDRSESAGATRR
jgi:hypothetical protein